MPAQVKDNKGAAKDAPVKAKPATKDTHQKEQPKKDIKGSERDDEDDEHDEFMARAEAKKGAK